MLVPSEPVSTDYEVWSGRGCMRRCDGQTAVVAYVDQQTGEGEFRDEACACVGRGWRPGVGEDVRAGACNLVTRVRLVVPDLPGVGIVMLTTHSWFAATELPGVADLLASLHGSGRLVEAVLAIEPREVRKATESHPRKFTVPVLRVRATPYELAAGNGAGGEGSTLAHPQRLPAHVAIAVKACREHGVGNDESKAVVRALTDGRTDSRKDLTIEEANRMAAVVADGSWRELATDQRQLPAAQPQPEPVSGKSPARAAKPKAATAKGRVNPYADAVHAAQREAGLSEDAFRAVLQATIASETANDVNRQNVGGVIAAIWERAGEAKSDGAEQSPPGEVTTTAVPSGQCGAPGCEEPAVDDGFCSEHEPF